MSNAGLTAASQMISAASNTISGHYLVYRGPEAIENVSYPLVLLKTVQELEWGQFNVTSGTIMASVVDVYSGKLTDMNDINDYCSLHGDKVYNLVKALATMPISAGYLIDARYSIVDQVQIDAETETPTVWGNFVIKYGLQE